MKKKMVQGKMICCVLGAVLTIVIISNIFVGRRQETLDIEMILCINGMAYVTESGELCRLGGYEDAVAQNPPDIKQLSEGEYLGILDGEGNFYSELQPENIVVGNNSSGMMRDRAEMVLRCNRDHKFEYVAGEFGRETFKALLSDGNIAVIPERQFDDMSILETADLHICVLSGNYALSDSTGRCYHIDMENLTLEEVFTGTDIVSIDAFGDECAAVQKDGTVLYLGDNEELENAVRKWKSITEVRIGRNFILGLRENGRVLVAGVLYDDPQTGAEIESWRDICAIATDDFYGAVGMKRDGSFVGAGTEYVPTGTYYETN